MKKIVLGTVTLLSIFALAACSSNTSTKSSSSSSSEAATESSSSVSEKTGSEVYSKESYIEFPYEVIGNSKDTYTIKSITKSTSSYNGGPIILIDLTYTNNGDTPNSPYMSFIFDWSAQQTDGTTTDTLLGANGGMNNVENQEAVKMGDANVNSGATVDAIIGFTLTHENSDVAFVDFASQMTGKQEGFTWANK